MSEFEKKLKDFVFKNKSNPKFLYIGTKEKLALMEKLKQSGINGKYYKGLEIVCVNRMSFYSLG